MTQIRVALVDDHPVVLAGVGALLRTASEIALVGEAATGEAALRMIADTAPDIAVIDISLPDMNGIELAGRIAALNPMVRVLALSVHEDRAYVQQLLQVGAKGYLLKRSAAEELVRAVRAVAAGNMYLDPAIVSKAVSERVLESAGDMHESLSPREQDVLRFVAQGFSNKEIGAKIQVSTKTVETYKARRRAGLSIFEFGYIMRMRKLNRTISVPLTITAMIRTENSTSIRSDRAERSRLICKKQRICTMIWTRPRRSTAANAAPGEATWKYTRAKATLVSAIART